MALTFDDGPHPEGTPAVLDVLDEAGIKATFFLVGEQVERRPALAAEIAGAGASGRPARLPAPAPACDERARGRGRPGPGGGGDRERDGVGRRLAPAAYGLYSPAGLAAVRRQGLQPLLWSRWGKDWRRLTTPERIAARASRELRPGDVILLHDADFYSSAAPTGAPPRPCS